MDGRNGIHHNSTPQDQLHSALPAAQEHFPHHLNSERPSAQFGSLLPLAALASEIPSRPPQGPTSALPPPSTLDSFAPNLSTSNGSFAPLPAVNALSVVNSGNGGDSGVSSGGGGGGGSGGSGRGGMSMSGIAMQSSKTVHPSSSMAHPYSQPSSSRAAHPPQPQQPVQLPQPPQPPKRFLVFADPVNVSRKSGAMPPPPQQLPPIGGIQRSLSDQVQPPGGKARCPRSEWGPLAPHHVKGWSTGVGSGASVSRGPGGPRFVFKPIPPARPPKQPSGLATSQGGPKVAEPIDWAGTGGGPSRSPKERQPSAQWSLGPAVKIPPLANTGWGLQGPSQKPLKNMLGKGVGVEISVPQPDPLPRHAPSWSTIPRAASMGKAHTSEKTDDHRERALKHQGPARSISPPRQHRQESQSFPELAQMRQQPQQKPPPHAKHHQQPHAEAHVPVPIRQEPPLPVLQNHRQHQPRDLCTFDTSAQRQVILEDAKAYVQQVKTHFELEPTFNDMFIDIMKNFHDHSISTVEATERVSLLFEGHPSLILGFNIFLPPGCKIQVPKNAQGMGFTGFSRPASFSEVPQQLKAVDARPYAPPPAHASAVCGTSTSPVHSQAMAGASAAQTERDVPVTSSSSKRLQVSIPRGKNPSATTIEAAYASPRQNTAADPRAVVPKQKAVRMQMPPPATAEARNSLPCVDELVDTCLGVTRPAKPTDMQAACDLFEKLGKCGVSKHKMEAIVEHLKKAVYRSPIPPTYDTLVVSMLELVGDQNKEILLSCLKQLPTHIGTPATADVLNKRVAGRAAPKQRVGPEDTDTGKGRQHDARGFDGRELSRRADAKLFFEEARRELGGSNSSIYQDFLKCILLFSEEIMSKNELISIVADLLPDRPNVQYMFVQHLELATSSVEDGRHGADSPASSATGGPPGNGQTIGEDRADTFRSKRISEIPAGPDIACSESDKKLPVDYSLLPCAGPSGLEKNTMNNTWVSVPNGLEDSYPCMRKNHNEDNLFRCEDDRYELDLVINTNVATIMKLEPIAATIAELAPGVTKHHVLADGALSAINFAAIRRIYGSYGPAVVEKVKFHPAVAVPVVLARMRDKDEQWRRARGKLNVIWRAFAEENYHRSLDHRSENFKQVDRKKTSAKSFVADILNPSMGHAARHGQMTRARGSALERGRPIDRSSAADVVALLASRGPSGDTPCLELPYKEKEMHRLVYSLVSTMILAGARDEPNDPSKATLASYRNFLEAFFGVGLSDDDGKENGDKIIESSLDQLGQLEMYGDESIYIFFRLHHLMFERLAAAKKMAIESAEDQKLRKRCDELGGKRVEGMRDMPVLPTAPSDLTRDLQTNGYGSDALPFQLNGGSLDPNVLFEEFILLLRELIAGCLMPLIYEERCRVILGPDSYILFTMDQTMSRLIKQVVTVFSPDVVTGHFVVLFQKYCENMRAAKTDDRRRGFEELYTVAATLTLRKTGEAGSNLFRLQHLRRSGIDGQLVIHVIGTTTTAGDEAKRADESAAIKKFLSFGMGLQGESGGEDAAEGENGSKNSGFGCEDDMKVDTIAGDSSQPDIANPATSSKAAKRRRLDGPDENDSAAKRRRCALRRKLRNSAVKLESELARFAGSATRVLDGNMLIRNELEYIIGPQQKLLFIDGKIDILVNLNCKRKWGLGSRQSAGDQSTADMKRFQSKVNAASSYARKFRSLVENRYVGQASSPFRKGSKTSAHLDKHTSAPMHETDGLESNLEVADRSNEMQGTRKRDANDARDVSMW